MARKRKQDVKINNVDSLEGLLQETYNDACLQLIDAQTSINELKNGATPADVDELTKVAKEKGGLLKVKDSAIRIKLELAKLQSAIINSKGDVQAGIASAMGKVTPTDYKELREQLKKAANTEDDLF